MVLIIDGDKVISAAIADMLYYMGIPCAVSAKPIKTTQISNIYDAVIFTEPCRRSTDIELVRAVRFLTLGAPSIAVVSSAERLSFEERALFDVIASPQLTPQSLLEMLKDCCSKNPDKIPGNYVAPCLNASSRINDVRYMGDSLGVTRSEAMIIRTLTRTHPLSVDSKTILRHAFRQGKAPDPSGIRTHICSINKKFLFLFGKRLIEADESGRYSLALPKIRPLTDIKK